MTKYTTRSAIETWGECPRKRLFNYFLLGTGVVPVGEYIPLVTGGSVHTGIEHNNPGATVKEFDRQVTGTFFRDIEEAQQDYTYHEQRALAEALTWVWMVKERPIIEQNFETVSIEAEYKVPLDSGGDIILLARPDRLLRERQTGELYTYSIKSIKSWYERMEKAYKVDLQGLTEAIAVTYQTKQKVLATKFCFLVKGRRVKQVDQTMVDGMIEESTQVVTQSPLIYGWRAEDGGKYRFAHSDKIVKPENMSGFGKLPKKEGWEKFKVWENYSMEKWVKALPRIQPELGDKLGECCICPTDTHRTMQQLKSRLIQISTTEKLAFDNYEKFENGENVDRCFPMQTRSCYFPSECEYLEICPNGNEEFDPAVAEDPLGSGKFIRRVPHYDTERSSLGSVTQAVDLG